MPIFKKGNKNEASNYRPVSLTSVRCKILESIIKDVVVEHLEQQGFYMDCQHGFVKGRSTPVPALTASALGTADVPAMRCCHQWRPAGSHMAVNYP